jgi:hypothetical protein
VEHALRFLESLATILPQKEPTYSTDGGRGPGRPTGHEVAKPFAVAKRGSSAGVAALFETWLKRGLGWGLSEGIGEGPDFG